jgi:hypothetical protein
VDAADKVTVQQAVLLVLCCPSDSLKTKTEEHQFLMYLSTPAHHRNALIFPMVSCSYHLYCTNEVRSVYM